MTVLAYLVPMALLLGAAWLATFLWSLHSGQYEDLEGAALRVLDDSDIDDTEEAHSSARSPLSGPAAARRGRERPPSRS